MSESRGPCLIQSIYDDGPFVLLAQSLMREALILAKQRDVDVFNALDLMENQLFLKELKFGHGDGVLHYYLYNWGCADIEPAHVGLVLL